MKTILGIVLSTLASLLIGLGGPASANITSVSPGSITNGSTSVTFTDYGGAFPATAASYSFGSLAPVTLSLGWTTPGETDFAGGFRFVLTTVNLSGVSWTGFDFSIPAGPVVFFPGDGFTPGIGDVTSGPTFGTFATDRYQSGANPNITVDSNNIHFTFSSQVADGSSFSTYLPFLFSSPPASEGTISLTGSPIPVPEPEIYAMLAAGLGLMGFVARRRQRHAE